MILILAMNVYISFAFTNGEKTMNKVSFIIAFTNQKNTFLKVLNLELDLSLILEKVSEIIYLIKKTYDP